MFMKISAIPKIISYRLLALVREMAPVVLFFFVVLGWILIMFKLFVAQYAIEYYAFTKAAIGALIIGKAVLLMEWAEAGRRPSRLPRVIVVLFRTMLYGMAVIALGIGERIIHGTRETGSLRQGFALIVANANLERFFGLVILISTMVGIYLTMEEISHAMGAGALRKLFFEQPAITISTIPHQLHSTL
jgi:hypothetical protein